MCYRSTSLYEYVGVTFGYFKTAARELTTKKFNDYKSPKRGIFSEESEKSCITADDVLSVGNFDAVTSVKLILSRKPLDPRLLNQVSEDETQRAVDEQ